MLKVEDGVGTAVKRPGANGDDTVLASIGGGAYEPRDIADLLQGHSITIGQGSSGEAGMSAKGGSLDN